MDGEKAIVFQQFWRYKSVLSDEESSRNRGRWLESGRKRKLPALNEQGRDGRDKLAQFAKAVASLTNNLS